MNKDWSPELDELRLRHSMTKGMGGPDKVARQHAGGRKTVRERVEGVLDPGSFHEIGGLVGKGQYDENGKLVHLMPNNSVMGRGTVNGRTVVIAGDDFTVRGGSADATNKAKSLYPEQMARELRVPIIRMIEGSGGGGSVKTIELTGHANLPGGQGLSYGGEQLMYNMGLVPSVGLGLGSVAGLGAARLAASHLSVMVKEQSAMFVAGPPVVKGIGQDLTKQELGGWRVQLAAGGVDNAVDSEEEAFDMARDFLSYMPQSIDEVPPRGDTSDPVDRREEKLFSIIPRDIRKVYRMRSIIDAVVDKGSFFEIAPLFGRSVIGGLARLNGWPVVLLASDPYLYGGAWTSDACQKVVRMVDLAETFHLPVVYLCDCPGFQVGIEAETRGTIRHGVRAMACIEQSTIPWCSIIVRNAFGVAGGAHAPTGRFHVRYAWLSARWGSLPLEGGIEAAYRADLDAAENREEKLQEITDRLNRLRSPFRTAETFAIEEMIDPRETRRLLCEFADLAAPLRKPGKTAFWMRP
ncbi:MAG: carboxyl transferase domain-containing protein [Pseudomonadota bacterium]|nr:carboxyl transferase domain-containing protein [Pseudomonadota bacterium]